MPKVGYASLVETLGLRVSPPARPAFVDTSVNRRVDTPDRTLFPTGVALVDTPLGHLEFALRHEGIDLPIIASALPAIGGGPLSGFRPLPRLRATRAEAQTPPWAPGSTW